MSRRRSPVKGRTRRGAALVALAVVLLLGAAATLVVQALQARDDLRAAGGQATRLKSALLDGDVAEARAAFTDLRIRAREARDETHNALWALAAHAPVWGDDLRAVRTVSKSLDELATGSLPGVVHSAGRLDIGALAPRHGRVDVRTLQRLAAALGPADRQLAGVASQLKTIRAQDLSGSLALRMRELQQTVGDASSAVHAADTALSVLPALLGASGPREHLVLFQNNAEVRATGGIPGAYAVIHADHGRVRLAAQGAGADFGEFPTPVLPLTAEERKLFTPVLGTYFQNTTLTPDFPRSARLAREMLRRRDGTTVDAVVSLDPVALSYLLAGTGPVRLPDGRELTADNAVRVLLHDTYLRFADPRRQNEFFASTAALVFDAVTSGRGDPLAVIRALTRAASERRLLLWSSHAPVRDQLAGSTVAGDVTREPADEANVGVYLNDVTGAKMDYFLDYQVRAGTPQCAADGAQTVPLIVRLTSTAPADSGASQPDSVVGPGFGVAARGETYVKLDAYAPVGGHFGAVTLDGKRAHTRRLHHLGHPVLDTYVLLRPGQTVTLGFEVSTAAGHPGDVHVDVTPGVKPENESFVVPTGCE